MIEIYTVNKITKSDALCDEDYVLATDYAKLEAEVARITTILYGKPMAAPEIPEVAAGPLMSVPQFFGMLNELRNSAQLHEATASAELAKETTDDATATHQIESLANQCQFQAERLVTLEAENAELRDMEQCSHELFEAACNDLGDAQEQLAAANATLDRLREVVQTGFDNQDIAWRVYTILYPTPENDNVLGE